MRAVSHQFDEVIKQRRRVARPRAGLRVVLQSLDVGVSGPIARQGLGLERMVSIIQDVPTNYDTDLIRPIIAKAEDLAEKKLNESPETEVAMKVIADHSRAAAFLINDGILPSNEGRGYVLRRVMRRAIRYGRTLGLTEAFFGGICRQVIDLMEAGAVDFVQVNYSLLEPEAGDTVLPMAQDKGVAILVNRPFINGDFFDVVRGRELPGWAAEFDCRSWAQFSLKFILSHPAVTCVLTETTNAEHLADNMAAGMGRLPDAAARAKMLELVQSFV